MDDLEQIIADIIRRKRAVEVGSAAYEFYERQLDGLRGSYEEAGGIIEDLDWNWGAPLPPLPPRSRPRRKAGFHRE